MGSLQTPKSIESTFDDRSEANTDQLDRSTRLLAPLTTQLDSAPRRSTRSTSLTLYLISMYTVSQKTWDYIFY